MMKPAMNYVVVLLYAQHLYDGLTIYELSLAMTSDLFYFMEQPNRLAMLILIYRRTGPSCVAHHSLHDIEFRTFSRCVAIKVKRR
jgi:hypothetical protein